MSIKAAPTSLSLESSLISLTPIVDLPCSGISLYSSLIIFPDFDANRTSLLKSFSAILAATTSPVLSETLYVIIPDPPLAWAFYSSNGVFFPYPCSVTTAKHPFF